MRLRTLGSLELEGSELRRPKPLLLLAYLALEGPQERGHLAELFFRGSSHGRGGLSTTLSRLRRSAPGVVGADDGRVWTEIATDAGELEVALREGDLEGGIDSYRGRFLDGFDNDHVGPELEEWIYAQRETIATRVRDALLHLAEQTAVPGQFDTSAELAERAWLLPGAPEPEPAELRRIYTLLRAGDHPKTDDVRREARAFEVELDLDRERARRSLVEAWHHDDLPPNPYKGLAYFKEEDAALFFGRERIVGDLLVRLERQPLLAIVGSSGSGKSSLVHAGLLPELRRRTDWLIATLRPGLYPFQALAGALLELLDGDDNIAERLVETKRLAEMLRGGSVTLSDLVARVRQRHPEMRLLLVIDQFEELFTIADEGDTGGRAVATAVVDQLVDALDRSDHAVGALLTLRADFMPAALEHRPLVDLLQRNEVLLGPMSADDLRSAIEAPARKRGVTLEPGLSDRILRDVIGREGGLPLLAFALSELWQHQEARRLTHAAYDAIGGVEWALANHAERTFERLSPDDQDALQAVLLQLVQPGQGQEDTRRIATGRELGEHWPLITRLASTPARLLVTGIDGTGQQTAEVIHEALIRHWARLRRLIDEHRSFRTWQEQLRPAVRRWSHRSDEGYLLRGFPLAEARQQLGEHPDHLSPDERAFIEASLDLETRERQERGRRWREREAQRRRLNRVLTAGLTLALLLTAVAGWQWNTARNRGLTLAERERQLTDALDETEAQRKFTEQQRDLLAAREQALTDALAEAERQELLATYRALQGQALAALQSDEIALASLLAAEGMRLATDDPGAQRDFLRVLLELPQQFHASVQGHSDGLAVSPDGTLLASGGDSVRLWDLATMELVAELRREGHGPGDVVFSPDGRTLVSAGGGLAFWDVATREPIGEVRWPQPDQIILGLGISPDGAIVTTTGDASTITLWDVATRTPIGEPLASGTGATNINGATFNPDGTLFASGEVNGNLVLWDVAAREPVAIFDDHDNSVGRAVFSPDGSILASADWNGAVMLWDVATRTRIGEPLVGHDEAVLGLAFSPDGRSLATGSYDRSIRLWDVATRTPIATLRGHADEVRYLAFTPDGRTLISGDIGGAVHVWRLEDERRLAGPLESIYVADIAVAPDGATFAIAGWSGTIQLWDIERRRAIDTFEGSPGYIDGIAFTPDGDLVSNDVYSGLVQRWGSDRRLVRSYGSHTTWTVAVSPDGSTLASGGLDGDLQFWDLASGEVLGGPLAVHEGRIWDLDFSPDSTVLATASDDRTIILWDVATHTPIEEPLRGHDHNVNDIAFSPDGTLLASGSEDHSVRLWDVATRTPSDLPLLGHARAVTGVAFHPDGHLVASASNDRTVVLWDVERRRPLTTPYHHDTELGRLAFTPDGGSLIVGGGGHITFWQGDPEPEDWFERACRLAGRNFTRDEWRAFLGDAPYRVTCPQFPRDG